MSGKSKINSRALSIGFGNIVMKDKVVAIVHPDSLPVKRLISGAEKDSKLINATMGKRTRAVIVMENDQVVLSGISAETIIARIDK